MRYKMHISELRTIIRIQRKVVTGTGIHQTISWIDLGNTLSTDPPRYLRCKWYPLGGSEAWIAQSVQVIDAANVVLRYNPLITASCRLIRGNIVYTIMGPMDPDQHREWTAFKVKASLSV
jgi:head-tail adaptor